MSLGTTWTVASSDVAAGTDIDTWRSPRIPTGIADHRLAATRACVASATTPRELVATLRHHGERPWGAPGGDRSDVAPPPAEIGDDFSGITVCMHTRGADTTTAAMVCDLPADPDDIVRAWFALGSPCASVFVPAFPPYVAPELSRSDEWERFALLRDRVEHDGDALAGVRAELAPVEGALWDDADACAGGRKPTGPSSPPAPSSRSTRPCAASASEHGSARPGRRAVLDRPPAARPSLPVRPKDGARAERACTSIWPTCGNGSPTRCPTTTPSSTVTAGSPTPSSTSAPTGSRTRWPPRGIGPGDHVAVYLYNSVEYLETMLAAFKLRAVPINVNYRYVEDELRYLFTDCDARAVVFHAEFAPKLCAIRSSLPLLQTFITVGGLDADDDLGALEYEAAIAECPPGAPAASARATTSTSCTRAARPGCPRA